MSNSNYCNKLIEEIEEEKLETLESPCPGPCAVEIELDEETNETCSQVSERSKSSSSSTSSIRRGAKRVKQSTLNLFCNCIGRNTEGTEAKPNEDTSSSSVSSKTKSTDSTKKSSLNHFIFSVGDDVDTDTRRDTQKEENTENGYDEDQFYENLRDRSSENLDLLAILFESKARYYREKAKIIRKMANQRRHQQ